MRAPRTALFCLALSVAGLAACSSTPTPTPLPVPVPASESASASPTPAVASEITLAFAGDVHFHERTRPALQDPEHAFGQYQELLKAADFTMVNLETAVTERGTEEPKNFHFRTPPTAYAALKAAGIDLVTVANNHALDYGQVGLLDTLESAQTARMPMVGAGRNVDEAYRPYFTTVKGVRLGVVAVSQVEELSASWKPTSTRPGIAMAFDRTRTLQAVAEVRSKADIVLVYLHWGTEGQACPKSDQTSIARALASAGADVVVGTHAHMLLGDGFIGQTYVHYGLGNFLWYSTSRSTDTGLLTVTIKDRKPVSRTFTAGVITNSGQPALISGAALTALQGRSAKAVKCAGLSQTPS